MLVELHSFPGYDEETLTPLPAPLSPLFILNVVIDAQAFFKNKVIIEVTILLILHIQYSILYTEHILSILNQFFITNVEEISWLMFLALISVKIPNFFHLKRINGSFSG